MKAVISNTVALSMVNTCQIKHIKNVSSAFYPMLFYWCFVWCRELTLMNVCIDTSKKKNVWEEEDEVIHCQHW